MASESINRQVIDIKASAGVGDIGNEVLRRWTDKGYEMAVKEGNYDRSREHLNFEIVKGGKIVPVDKTRPLDVRMAELLAERGIRDPNIGRSYPNIRTAVKFVFGGSHDRMTELAFGNQEVDFAHRGEQACIIVFKQSASPCFTASLRIGTGEKCKPWQET